MILGEKVHQFESSEKVAVQNHYQYELNKF